MLCFVLFHYLSTFNIPFTLLNGELNLYFCYKFVSPYIFLHYTVTLNRPTWYWADVRGNFSLYLIFFVVTVYNAYIDYFILCTTAPQLSF